MLQAVESLRSRDEDSELLDLLNQLEATQARRLTFEATDADGDNPHDRAHWWYRELIARKAAKAPTGLRAKARAAELALEYDGGCGAFPSTTAGSFINLMLSMRQDLVDILKTIERKADAPSY